MSYDWAIYDYSMSVQYISDLLVISKGWAIDKPQQVKYWATAVQSISYRSIIEELFIVAIDDESTLVLTN